MIIEKLKKIKNSNQLFIRLFSMLVDLYTWFLNYVISYIPFWHVRKFFFVISGMKIGKGSRIGLDTKIIRPSKIIIGENSVINEHCHLDGRGGIIIGNNSSVSIYTKIITASHQVNDKDFEYYESPVLIEDHVWIGCGAIVLDGSVMKKGSVLGAGAVLKGTTEEYGIYVGNPPKCIKKRDENIDYQIKFNPFFK